MSTVDSQLAALTAAIADLNSTNQQILTAVQALAPAKADDLTPVTTALTAVQMSLNTVEATTAAIAAKLPVDQASPAS